MNRLLLLIALFTFTLQSVPRKDIFIWPYPSQYQDTKDGTSLFINKHDFKISVFDSQHQVVNVYDYPSLKNAIQRFRERTFMDWKWEDEPKEHYDVKMEDKVTEIQIYVKDLDTDIKIGVQENYTLEISKEKITLQTETYFGILRGLETFSQLIQYTGVKNYYFIKNTPIAVNDFPRFQWRGFSYYKKLY